MSGVMTHDFTLSQADFDRFAQLSGDDNPIHVDPAYAARSEFGRPVAHGMMLYAIINGFLGDHFDAARQAAVALTFRAPTFAGEPLRLTVRPTPALTGGLDIALDIRRLNDGAVTVTGTTHLTWEA